MRLHIIVLIVLCVSTAHANIFITEEAKTIYTSEELDINLEISGGATITHLTPNQQLRWIQGDINFFPINTDRQLVLQEVYTPYYHDRNESHISFRWNRVQDTEVRFSASYLVKTRNEYQEIQNKIPFPIRESLPSDVRKYLEFGSIINYADDISTTASLIASGKDDLFDVAQAVAYWVNTNIEYDLSTLGQDVDSSASQVIIDRRGICNELSILFISMMRTLGVPARYVSGIAYTNSDLFDEQWVPHAWAEVYFPGYGWVPFDLTYAQFGYVDAGHIKFSDSHDVGSIRTNFRWQATNIDQVRIRLLETDFDLSVQNARGQISDKFTLSLEPAFSGVRIGSYNILQIHAENNADHYVSSVLQISKPREVSIEQSRIPIFLLPREKKTFYVLLEVSNQLSPQFIYEMPVSVFTQNGVEYQTSFSVSSSYSDISFRQVNAFLETYGESNQGTEEVRINCEAILERGALSPVTCLVENLGNVYMVDTEICLESSALIQEACVIVDIPINQAYTFRTNILTNEQTEQEATVVVTRDGNRATRDVLLLVKDTPRLEIGEINPDFSEIKIVLHKRSVSIPQNIELFLETRRKSLSWDIPSIPTTAEVNIPFSPHYLESGTNTLEVQLLWKDEDGEVYELRETFEMTHPERSFLEGIRRFFYLLIH